MILALALLPLAIWIYLLGFREKFWLPGPFLAARVPQTFPSVVAIVPARDEAGVIQQSLRSLVAQDYQGPFKIILIDDNSADETVHLAETIAEDRIKIISGKALEPGWSGKLWAIEQGLRDDLAKEAAYIWLTDADIEHESCHLSQLVAKAETETLVLVSEMVTLNCTTLWEQFFVPAFVYFFQMLFPFRQVDRRASKVAAAAGGTMLVQREALERIGGVAKIRTALIDDVGLAKAMKVVGPIWLGHAKATLSLRQYHSFSECWRMITRTAYAQLNYNPLILVLTLFGMAVTFVLPVMLTFFSYGLPGFLGLTVWLMMGASFVPTLKSYRQFFFWSILLPFIALFYTAATFDSALRYYRGQGGNWKGRVYKAEGA